MANKKLGQCNCPLCDFPDQEVREDKNGKPYMVCDECGCQIFARQAKSIRKLRERMEPVVEEEKDVVEAEETGAGVVEKPVPAKVPELPTIFDMLSGKGVVNG